MHLPSATPKLHDMIREGAYRRILACFIGLLSGSACASKQSATGDETHFQACTTTGDCKSLGDAYRCESGACKLPVVSGTGGRGAASGTGGAPGGGGGAPAGSGGSSNAFCAAVEATSGDLDGGVVHRLLGDAASACTIRAADYDRSCSKDADCVEVGEGNACEAPCVVACATTAINVSAMAAYEADYARNPIKSCGDIFCGCPCIGAPRCVRGTCELSSCGAMLRDAAIDGN